MSVLNFAKLSGVWGVCVRYLVLVASVGAVGGLFADTFVWK